MRTSESKFYDSCPAAVVVIAFCQISSNAMPCVHSNTSREYLYVQLLQLRRRGLLYIFCWTTTLTMNTRNRCKNCLNLTRYRVKVLRRCENIVEIFMASIDMYFFVRVRMYVLYGFLGVVNGMDNREIHVDVLRLETYRGTLLFHRRDTYTYIYIIKSYEYLAYSIPRTGKKIDKIESGTLHYTYGFIIVIEDQREAVFLFDSCLHW